MATLGDKVWAGSDNGLCVFDGVNWEIHNKKLNNIIPSDQIISMQTNANNLWVATDNGICYNNGRGFLTVSGYPGGRARAVIGNGAGSIAIGTAYGVILDNRTIDNIVSKEVTALAYAQVGGDLVIGTRAGISTLSGNMPRNYTGPAKSVMGSSLIDIPANPSNCRLPGNLIKAIIPYKAMFAVGTTEGLCITDLNNTYINYTAEHKEWMQQQNQILDQVVPGNSDIPGNKVLALAKTDHDELLFVVTDQGLGILKDKEWLKVDTLMPGIPKVGLTSVTYCNGNLWIGSDDGIYCVKNIEPIFVEKEEKAD